MAFDARRFVICSKFPLFKADCNLWLYTTSDSLEDCLSENYFQPRMNTKNQDSPEVGDIIQCIVGTGTLAYLRITAKTEKPYNITVEKTYLENEAEIYEAIYLAANSGDQLYETGVWYAKMYSDTVVPSGAEYDGRNYADFSQVDNEGNPIIVIYEGQNGSWVEIDRITPPAEYNGYMTITSKIWDISEQAGQQGGKVLWSHNQKTFTPYPQIISFENINVTGDSNVIMPQNPGDNQIVNKNYVEDYVDEAIASIPTPTVDIKQSIDAEIVGSVTVTDAGDVTGFTQNDYLLYPGCMNVASAGSLELFFAFTTNTATNGISLFVPSLSGSGVENVSLTSTTNAQDVTTLRFVVSSGLNQISIYGTTPILPNTKYYAKVIYDGTDYSLSVSTDNVVWISEGTVTATIVPGAYTQGRYRIGINGAPLISNSGIKTMHMKECYIKEGGIVTWQGLGDPGLHQRVSKAEADYVVETQFPTSANNYTWYRKYKSGWVEQGQRSLNVANQSHNLYTLPVPMADTDYWAAAGPAQISSTEMYNAASTVAALAGTTTQVRLGQYNTANATMRIWWEVRGMAA